MNGSHLKPKWGNESVAVYAGKGQLEHRGSWGIRTLKRLSAQRRVKMINLNLRRMRKRSHRPTVSANVGLTAEAKNNFITVRNSLPDIIGEYISRPDRFTFHPPKVMSLSKNYDETFAFILDFKKIFFERKRHLCEDGVRRLVFAEFADMERIGPGAGLVLAAEVHRYAQHRGKPPKMLQHQWAENVRQFFIESGMFELLKIDPATVGIRPSADSQRSTLKIMSGRTSQGRDVKDLILRLQGLVGSSLDHRPAVYAAIAEALANVSHAYPSWHKAWPYRVSRRWWATGFWNPTSKTVGLQLYDQGAGIPATLPRQPYWPRIIGLGRLDPERTASGLIAAALDYGRTSTGQAGRGKGLAEMANWIETTGSGFLRILSGGGEITYLPGGKVLRRDFDAPFYGTLVEWEVSVAA